MTDEQQERLQEIRERVAERALYADPPLWDDIVFLLGLRIDSLLTPDEAELVIGAIPLQSGLIDSQVAEDKYVCEVCGQSDEHTLECPTPSWCPGCGSRKIGHQWNTCHDAATSMRSACIERVKAQAAAHRQVADGLTDRLLAEVQRVRADECDALVNQLESVTIQSSESK